MPTPGRAYYVRKVAAVAARMTRARAPRLLPGRLPYLWRAYVPLLWAALICVPVGALRAGQPPSDLSYGGSSINISTPLPSGAYK